MADEVTKRIQQLVRDYLKKVATDRTGWEVLYRDPGDGRYWELSYHGRHSRWRSAEAQRFNPRAGDGKLQYH